MIDLNALLDDILADTGDGPTEYPWLAVTTDPLTVISPAELRAMTDEAIRAYGRTGHVLWSCRAYARPGVIEGNPDETWLAYPSYPAGEGYIPDDDMTPAVIAYYPPRTAGQPASFVCAWGEREAILSGIVALWNLADAGRLGTYPGRRRKLMRVDFSNAYYRVYPAPLQLDPDQTAPE